MEIGNIINYELLVIGAVGDELILTNNPAFYKKTKSGQLKAITDDEAEQALTPAGSKYWRLEVAISQARAIYDKTRARMMSEQRKT